MVERRSNLPDSHDPRRLGMEWFLDALFPNGKTVAIRGFAEGSEGSECSGRFRYVKSTRDHRSGPSAQAPILSPDNANARTPRLAIIAAVLSERAKQVWRHVNGRGFDVQTCLAAFGWSIELACGLASLVSRPLIRLREKWENAISSPWFPLLCASVSFAVLLLLTGAFTGMALTKQPGRANMTAEPRIRAMTSPEKSQPIERNVDSDLIAVLIELTSHEEVDKNHSASPAVSSGLSRVLLEARSFATVPLKDWPTNGYVD